MMTLLGVEMRRYLSRRVTRVLVLLALVVIAIVGIAVYAANEPLGPGEFVRGDDPRLLTAQWNTDDPESSITVGTTAVFLIITALMAGASMVGAEWKAGTFTHLLTWEPRRVRVATAKFLAAGILATAIGGALVLCFSAAFLPTILSKGSTAGADAEWWLEYFVGTAKLALATGVAAVVGASIAMLGRNTTGAVGLAFGYFAVAEPLIRGLRPQYQRWLVIENVVAFLSDGIDDPIQRTGTGGGAILLVYAVVLAAVAAGVFSRRDVAGTV